MSQKKAEHPQYLGKDAFLIIADYQSLCEDRVWLFILDPGLDLNPTT